MIILSELRSITMPDDENHVSSQPKRTPWNKGKLIGAKPPLRPKHVWSIRTKLQVEERIRDLALFNVAIDSKLRGCDVVALKVEDVAPNGYAFGYSPGLLPAALTYASIACRVCSVNSKLTGFPVYFCCPVYF